jgi:hypothetical protein
MPNYSDTLRTLKGSGRAIVSEPGNTERVIVNFVSNREKSLVKVKNSLGIEGGEMLTDGDSLLIYNKIDKVARRVAVAEGNLSRIDNLASLNILKLVNFAVAPSEVKAVLESPDLYQLLLKSGARLFVDKGTFTVQEVQQPASSKLPYSKITYDAYGEIDGFRLPRRITIFSSDAKSRMALSIQSLDVNSAIEEPAIQLPDNITFYSR